MILRTPGSGQPDTSDPLFGGWAADRILAPRAGRVLAAVPQIPDVDPDTALLLAKALTGAVSSTVYLFSPWANQLGGTG